MLRLTDEERAALQALGRPLGPAVVAAALGRVAPDPAPVTWREALAALEDHAAKLRGSPYALTAVKQVADLRQTLERAA